jgi:hypothetical protein
MLTCLNQPVMRPSSYTIACGDGNAYWTDVTWSGWGTRRAIGTGIISINQCVPDCADGTFESDPLTVTLTRIVNTSRYGPLYSIMDLSYTFEGAPVSDTEPLPT